MMMTNAMWMNFPYRAPLLLVLVAGMVYALATWNRHRTVSLLAFLGSLLMLVYQVGFPYWTTMMFNRMNQQGTSMTQIARAMNSLGIISSLVLGVSVALLLGAAFGWRKTATPHP